MTMIEVTCEGVLFDCDGVLVDSHHLVGRAWQQVANEFDLDFTALLAELAGVRAIETLSRHLPEPAAQRATVRLEELELGLAVGTRAIEGATELLAELNDIPWAIVTSASRRLAEARWKGAGIPVPRYAVTADDVVLGKPDPLPYLRAAELLGVEPRSCIVFEDAPSGARAAAAAGATVVAVGPAPWPFEPIARIDDLSAVRFVRIGDTSTFTATLAHADEGSNP